MRLILLLLLGVALQADQPAKNWSGNFDPCNNSPELLRHDHMDLGVRLNTANPVLARAFERAMDFWAKVLDMTWHRENSAACSVQIVDGTRDLFKASEALVARSQFTEWAGFKGWIAFDPRVPLTKVEFYLTAIHEIGHMLGLRHNPSAKSLMYFMNLEGPESLDRADLESLATRHRLRVASIEKPIAALEWPLRLQLAER